MAIMIGCGSKETESSSAPDDSAPVTKSVAAPVESLPLPEGFPEIIPVMTGMVITVSEVKNADNNEFKVVGTSTEDVDLILEYYVNAFEIGEWEEDMVMAQHGNNQASFIKGNLLVFMDAQTSEQGSVITLTTGTSD
jgi:hypothetical protein